MKKEIIDSINDPQGLENLFRSNKTAFRTQFNETIHQFDQEPLAQFWKIRLEKEEEVINWGSSSEIILIVVSAFLAGFVAKIPSLFSIDPEYYFLRNIGFVVFPFLSTYFIIKQRLTTNIRWSVGIATMLSLVFINLLPENPQSQTLILSGIHLPILLWALFGFSFVGSLKNDVSKRLQFLRFNGDLLVMTVVILLSGGLMTAITIGLFELINLNIENFYFGWIGIWGASSAPIVATFLVDKNPQLVNKVSPIVARVFTPLVLVMLIIYLIAIVFTGQNPYQDREFLIIFNILLIGVMALILFSVAENSRESTSKLGKIVLFALSVVTIIVNAIALSAIIFRMMEWGLTPNRAAVFGSNVLMLVHLIMVCKQLMLNITASEETEKVELAITKFLPIYVMWVVLVVFAFPLLFA